MRDWLYVEDHVHALDMVRQNGKPGETFNIGGNNERNNIGLVKDLCSIFDELSPVNENPLNQDAGLRSYADLIQSVADRPGHDFRYAIDSRKIQSNLGWRPLEDPVSDLREAAQWYLQHRLWLQDIMDQLYRLERLGTSKP